jgi:hypothetical protein
MSPSSSRPKKKGGGGLRGGRIIPGSRLVSLGQSPRTRSRHPNAERGTSFRPDRTQEWGLWASGQGRLSAHLRRFPQPARRHSRWARRRAKGNWKEMMMEVTDSGRARRTLRFCPRWGWANLGRGWRGIGVTRCHDRRHLIQTTCKAVAFSP